MSIEMVFPIPVMLDKFHRSLTTEEMDYARSVYVILDEVQNIKQRNFFMISIAHRVK